MGCDRSKYHTGNAQFYRIWSEYLLNVVLIKRWWHKGELRTCKGEGIEVWLSRELWEAQPVGVEAVMNAVGSWPSRDLRGPIDTLMAPDPRPPRFDLFSSFQQMNGFRMHRESAASFLP